MALVLGWLRRLFGGARKDERVYDHALIRKKARARGSSPTTAPQLDELDETVRHSQQHGARTRTRKDGE